MQQSRLKRSRLDDAIEYSDEEEFQATEKELAAKRQAAKSNKTPSQPAAADGEKPADENADPAAAEATGKLLKPRKKRPKLDEELLLSPRGFPALLHFNDEGEPEGPAQNLISKWGSESHNGERGGPLLFPKEDCLVGQSISDRESYIQPPRYPATAGRRCASHAQHVPQLVV